MLPGGAKHPTGVGDTSRMDPPAQPGERFGLLVGGLLIAEGSLFAALRFLQVVYIIASEAGTSDRYRVPLPRFLPWLLITAAVVTVLVWAGAGFRRSPIGAWHTSGTLTRVMMVLAALLNVFVLVRSAWGLARGPGSGEGLIAWISMLALSAVVLAGIARDVLGVGATGSTEQPDP
jgi:hypothetical protein